MGLPGLKLVRIPQASRRGRRPEAGGVGTERRRVLDSAGWHRPWGVRCLCREGVSARWSVGWVWSCALTKWLHDVGMAKGQDVH